MSEEKGAEVPSYTNDGFQRDRVLIRKQARDIDKLTVELDKSRAVHADLENSLATAERERDEFQRYHEAERRYVALLNQLWKEAEQERDEWKAEAQAANEEIEDIYSATFPGNVYEEDAGVRERTNGIADEIRDIRNECAQAKERLQIVTADRDRWKETAQKLAQENAIDDCNKSFQWRATALQLGRDRHAYLDATRALVQVVNSLMKVGCVDIHPDDQYDLAEGNEDG